MTSVLAWPTCKYKVGLFLALLALHLKWEYISFGQVVSDMSLNVKLLMIVKGREKKRPPRLQTLVRKKNIFGLDSDSSITQLLK